MGNTRFIKAETRSMTPVGNGICSQVYPKFCWFLGLVLGPLGMALAAIINADTGLRKATYGFIVAIPIYTVLVINFILHFKHIHDAAIKILNF